MTEELLSCPNCSTGTLDFIRTSDFIFIEEDDKMMFFCENCGWYKIEEHYFNLTWNIEIKQALAPIDILQSLLTDTKTVSFLRPRLKGISHLSMYKDASDEYIFGEIGIAYQTYLRQMIVLSTTYVELILRDFFGCLFIAQPLRMNRYLSPGSKEKATVTLNEIINMPSREELIVNLAKQATAIAVGPKFDKVVGTIVKQCKLELEMPLIEDLRELNELRNRIIHEGAKEEIRIEQVYNAFGLVLFLLYILGQAAKNKKYRMPYLDEFGFLRDFENQLQKN